MNYHDLIKQLGELYDNEHGDCDSGTCSMAKAWSSGYDLIAIEQFAGSGAGSDEFYRLYQELTQYKGFKRDLDAQYTEFRAEPDCEAIECGNGCGAYIYDFQWHGKEVHCDSCGKSFANPKSED